MKSLFLDAIHCQNRSKRPPFWIMRQAGRYLPEYRKLRKRYSFVELSHTPELAAQITLQPLKRFPLDAAILFSDILVIAETLGFSLHYEEGVGPSLTPSLNKPADIQHLSPRPVRETLDYVTNTIQHLLPSLKIPLIGFCGSPFTVASYIIEGKGSPSLRKTKKWMAEDPLAVQTLIDKLTQVTLAYLNMQIDAGVQSIQIFESVASQLSPEQFHTFSLPSLKKLVNSIKPKIPVILFCRGSSLFLPELVNVNPTAISLDWQTPLSKHTSIPNSIALQGNMDPTLLYAPQSSIKKEVTRILDTMNERSGYIFNLGHGILPDIPLESVHELADTIINYSS